MRFVKFNVVTDTYGAEYGKRPGAQVSIITGSGTNQFHGSAYEFIRNNALDARNFFDQGSAPQFQRNVFGGALGGPIKKDKLFVFGNYEGYRQHLGLSDVTLVPDNGARQGFVGNTFVGLAPGVPPLLALWPVQNGPELGDGIGVAYSHPLQRIREDFGTTRLDYNISDKDALFTVYTIDDSGANTPTINPLSLVAVTLREQVLSVQEQHVFSPTFLNTFRAGFSRANFYFTGSTPVDLPGWVAGAPIGAVVVGGGTAPTNGASQISGAGTNAGSNLPARRNLFTFDDHIAWSHGIHQVTAGAWVQRIQANDNLAQNQYGQASFGSLTAFLQGTISTFTVVPSSTLLGWRSTEAAGFVQDSIKLRPNLDLRIGFRFESTTGWNEVSGRASNYTFTNGVINTNPQVGSSALTVNNAKFLPMPRDRSLPGIRLATAKLSSMRDSESITRCSTIWIIASTRTVPSIRLSYLRTFLSSIGFVPGQAPPSGSKVSPSGIQPDAQTPGLATWNFKIEQQIAPSTMLALGVCGFAWISRASLRGRQRAVSYRLPSASPCPPAFPPAPSITQPEPRSPIRISRTPLRGSPMG